MMTKKEYLYLIIMTLKFTTYGLKEVVKSVGTKSSFLVPLFTLDDKYIGTIGIDYVTKKKNLLKTSGNIFR